MSLHFLLSSSSAPQKKVCTPLVNAVKYCNDNSLQMPSCGTIRHFFVADTFNRRLCVQRILLHSFRSEQIRTTKESRSRSRLPSKTTSEWPGHKSYRTNLRFKVGTEYVGGRMEKTTQDVLLAERLQSASWTSHDRHDGNCMRREK